MDQPLSPAVKAAELRVKAAALSGAERDYCLWLAAEWDKAIKTVAPGRPARPQADVGQDTAH